MSYLKSMLTYRTRKVLEIISSLILGLGFISLTSPLLIYWFINGNYERYIWIISGPYPFNSFGSGPFQLFMFLGLLIFGILLIILSFYIENFTKNK